MGTYPAEQLMFLMAARSSIEKSFAIIARAVENAKTESDADEIMEYLPDLAGIDSDDFWDYQVNWEDVHWKPEDDLKKEIAEKVRKKNATVIFAGWKPLEPGEKEELEKMR